MNLFGYYVEKKHLYLVIAILLLIIIGIISVNIRLGKQKENVKYVGYVSEDPEANPDAKGEEAVAGQLALYDYYTLMPYFSTTTDAMDFKVYLNDYIAHSGTLETEWWIKDVIYNKKTHELTFRVVSNTEETFSIAKTNEKTYISYTHNER